MGSQKFIIGASVKVARYPPKISKKVAERYGGKIGKIISMRHIKGRLWYKVSFGNSFYSENVEEFTSGELTRV